MHVVEFKTTVWTQCELSLVFEARVLCVIKYKNVYDDGQTDWIGLSWGGRGTAAIQQ